MKKQKSNVFKILMVLLCAVVIFCGVGFGSYVLSNISEISSSGDVIDSSDRVTVEFKYQMYTGLTETFGSEITYTDTSGNTYTSSSDATVTISASSGYTALSNYLTTHSDKYTIDTMAYTGSYSCVDKADSDVYLTFVVTAAVEVTSTTNQCTGAVTYSYSGTYYIQKQSYSSSYASNTYDSGNVQHTITIPKGSSLTENYLSSFLTLDSSDGDYYFIGLVTESNGSPSTTYYEYGDEITSDTVFYAVFNKAQSSDSTFATGSITNTVNNATSTTNIYLGTGSSSTDVSLDYTYSSTLKSFALGTSGGSAVTIASGATINFCLGGGTISSASVTGTASSSYGNYIEPASKNRVYTITLQADLEVNGTLVIGGSYGSGSNTNFAGNIYQSYVTLDLNGHNINVNNGGSLTSYGMIQDSAGTGNINVTGSGKIKTLIVIFDYKGGTSTTNACRQGVCPFQEYLLPYLRCTINFYYSDSNWGSLLAICRMHLTSSIVSDQELNVIGGGSGYLFNLSAGSSDSYIELRYETLDVVREESSSNDTQLGYVNNYCLDIRNKISFHNVDFSIGVLTIEVSIGDYDTDQFNFPISSFFDILLYSSSLSFSQQIQFQPGLSFYADENSSIIFQSGAELSILDRPIYYWYQPTNSLVTTLNVTAPSQATWCWGATYLWKYLSTASIDIYGKILFTTGNSSSTVYRFAGPCNFNEDNVGTINGTTETLYGSQTSGTYSNPFEFVNANSCYVQTYGYDFEPATYTNGIQNIVGYCRPLVSYDNKAYAVSSSYNYVGTYDFSTGIFTVGSSTYCFIQSTAQANVDDTVSIYSCTENSDHTITANSSTYVYFAGMFLPYSDGTCTTSVLNVTTTSVSVSYTNTYWHR